jgi:hypothetical protein
MTVAAAGPSRHTIMARALRLAMLSDALHRPARPPGSALGTGEAVIDPVGIAGPRELDVANAALFNLWGEEPAPNWPSRGSSARQLVCEAGHLARSRQAGRSGSEDNVGGVQGER